jgi:hypothetical protein
VAILNPFWVSPKQGSRRFLTTVGNPLPREVSGSQRRELVTDLLVRRAPYLLRLAMLFALTDKTVTMGVPHLEAALVRQVQHTVVTIQLWRVIRHGSISKRQQSISAKRFPLSSKKLPRTASGAPPATGPTRYAVRKLRYVVGTLSLRVNSFGDPDGELDRARCRGGPTIGRLS